MSAEGSSAPSGRAGAAPPTAVFRLLGAAHTFLYRLTGGALGGRFGRSPILLLTTTGRKTGKERTTPLLYLADGDALVVVASKGGAPQDPAWWLNLKSNPTAKVQVGRRVMSVTAEQAAPEERRRLWPLLTRMYPPYEDYQKRTTREIPVVILRPSGS
jgi:F420H(2)-dependent quinone reductase